MEVEFVTLANANKEEEWLQSFLLDMRLCLQPMPTIFLYCDRQAVLSKALNKIYNDKSRQISVKHGCIRQLISKGIISITFMRSYKNLVNPLTEAYTTDLVNDTSMGLR